MNTRSSARASDRAAEIEASFARETEAAVSDIRSENIRLREDALAADNRAKVATSEAGLLRTCLADERSKVAALETCMQFRNAALLQIQSDAQSEKANNSALQMHLADRVKVVTSDAGQLRACLGAEQSKVLKLKTDMQAEKNKCEAAQKVVLARDVALLKLQEEKAKSDARAEAAASDAGLLRSCLAAEQGKVTKMQTDAQSEKMKTDALQKQFAEHVKAATFEAGQLRACLASERSKVAKLQADVQSEKDKCDAARKVMMARDAAIAKMQADARSDKKINDTAASEAAKLRACLVAKEKELADEVTALKEKLATKAGDASCQLDNQNRMMDMVNRLMRLMEEEKQKHEHEIHAMKQVVDAAKICAKLCTGRGCNMRATFGAAVGDVATRCLRCKSAEMVSVKQTASEKKVPAEKKEPAVKKPGGPCVACGVQECAMWRKGESGEVMCNACGCKVIRANKKRARIESASDKDPTTPEVAK